MAEPDGTKEPDGTGTKPEGEGTEEVFPKWMGQGPDRYKEHEAFKGFAQIENLQDDYLKIKGDMDSSIKVPGEGATDEDIQGFLTALGRPEKAEDYKFEETKFPEGLPKSEELEKAFMQVSHTLGLTNPQAEGLYAFYNNIMINAFNEQRKATDEAKEATEKALKDADEALHKEWGKDYDTNLELMKRAMKQFGGEDFEKLIDSSKLGNDPLMIKAFVNIGKTMGEGEFIEGKPSPDKKQTEEEKAKEQYPDMVANGIPVRQELAPQEEPDEDLKKRFPDMNLENL